jgi:hypothetical protein
MTEKELIETLAREFKQDTFMHLIFEPQPTFRGYVLTVYAEHLRAGDKNEERKLFTIQTHTKEHAEMVMKKLTQSAKDTNKKTPGGIIFEA